LNVADIPKTKNEQVDAAFNISSALNPLFLAYNAAK
jgi:hypothetical protein